MARGRKPQNNLPKEIRENVVESKLPKEVMKAIHGAVLKLNAEPVEETKPKRLVGHHPITKEPVYI